MALFADKFGYYEPPIGALDRLHCSECVHTLDGAVRHYGVIKTLSPHDPNYGKLCLYCDLQEAYVKPFAWCNKAENNKMIGGGDGVVEGRAVPDEHNRKGS